MRRTILKILFPFVAPFAVLVIFLGVTILDIGVLRLSRCLLSNIIKIPQALWRQRPQGSQNNLQNHILWALSIPLSVVVFFLQKGIS